MKNLMLGIMYSLTKEAKKKRGEPRHILVTGHSGAGKTTLADELAEEYSMPIFHLDYEPEWRDMTGKRRSEKIPDKEWYLASKKVVQRGLKKESPHVIEGNQILRHPGLRKGYRTILVDVPEDAILEQRLRREVVQDRNKGMTRFQLDNEGRKLLDLNRDRVKRFKSNKDIENYIPPHIREDA